MCQTCGCESCEKCGGEIKDGNCSGCGKPSSECICQKEEGE